MADSVDNGEAFKRLEPTPAEIEEALAQAKSVLPPETYGLLKRIADTYLRAKGLIKVGKITIHQLRRLLRVPLRKTVDPMAPQDPPGSA